MKEKLIAEYLERFSKHKEELTDWTFEIISQIKAIEEELSDFIRLHPNLSRAPRWPSPYEAKLKKSIEDLTVIRDRVVSILNI